jgi:5'-nucleotidase
VRELKATSLNVVLETPITIGTDPESPLGNLITDVLLQSLPGADLAVNNTVGGLRADLPEGPLTYGRLFETLPFDNMIVRVSLTGAAVERMVADRLQRGRNLPGIAGLQVRAACADGALRVELLRLGGRLVEDDEQVSVVTTDFLATGGDGIFSAVTPPQGLVVEDTGRQVRDAAADWFRRRGGRLREADLVNRENPRWLTPAPVPVSCR